MRSADEIKKLIVDFARQDERIRAVLLNGSRADRNLEPDKFQDFDIVFIVDNKESFTQDHRWTEFLGDKIISQLPDEMCFGRENMEAPDFHHLMLFKDRNRIDLTLFPRENFKSDFKLDSLTIVWLDKDNLFPDIPEPSNKDYLIKEPNEKEFSDTCNEFWWVSTYVAKGLLRNEITYAKEMLETVVRPMFMKVIEWKIGMENNYSVSFGTAGKFMAKYLPEKFYKKVLLTYSNFEEEENWKSLFIMVDIFAQTSKEVSEKLNFRLNIQEQEKTTEYLKQRYEEKQGLAGKMKSIWDRS